MPNLVKKTPIASPDTLRAFLQTSKRFYGLHTARNIGYTDIDGLQYSGTVENFGSEMLLETRKMRMLKPPANAIRTNDNVHRWFDLSDSDYINTYLLQHMMMAVPKTSDMDPRNLHRIILKDCVETCVPITTSDSDKFTYRLKVLVTNTSPVYRVDYPDGTYVEYTLKMYGDSDTATSITHTRYCYPLDNVMSPLISYDENNQEWVTRNMIGYHEIPFLFVCFDDLNMWPPVSIVSNADRNANPLLSLGTNGHDMQFMFPLCYGFDNLPDNEGYPETLKSPAQLADGEYQWYLKVHGDFIEEPETEAKRHIREINRGVQVTSIEFCLGPKENPYTAAPVVSHEVSFDVVQRFVKITICELNDFDNRDPEHPMEMAWTFRRPKPGDYDYDSQTYVNPVVGYISLSRFKTQTLTDALVPALQVHFADEYFHPYEPNANEFKSGIHVDYTTDYSDHSVNKKFGVIHDLSDFDGLPSYYYRYLDRSVHRAHVELYAIRHDANVRNQHATDRQTAAIILDSAIPKNEIILPEDMEPAIVYDVHGKHTYITHEDKVVSKKNVLTDVAFISNRHFGDANLRGNGKRLRFLYHGNHHFSLSMVGFDSELQYGRGYLITNDPTRYINNELENFPKAPRTVARICDIPTDFTQLISIDGKSPTLLIDKKYVRSEAAYRLSRPIMLDQPDTSDTDNMIFANDFQQLWNLTQPARYIGGYTNTYSQAGSTTQVHINPFVYDKDELERVQQEDVINANGLVATPTFTIQVQPNTTVPLTSDPAYTITIIDGGSGYDVNDMIGFNIGGVFFKGQIATIDAQQGVESFVLNPDDRYIGMADDSSIPIQLANMDLENRVATYQPSNIIGNGSQLTIAITISEATMAQYQDYSRKIPRENVFALVRRNTDFGVDFVPFVYGFNPHWDFDHATQLSGDLENTYSVYDANNSSAQDTSSVFMYNTLNHQPFLLFNQLRTTSKIANRTSTTIPYQSQLFDTTDQHQLISDTGHNEYGSYYAIMPTQEPSDEAVLVQYHNPSLNNELAKTPFMLPRRNQIALYHYNGIMSNLTYYRNPGLGGVSAYMYDVTRTQLTTVESVADETAYAVSAPSSLSLATFLQQDSDDHAVYMLLTSIPDDWEVAYKTYYVLGTENAYVPVESEIHAPEWVPDMYWIKISESRYDPLGYRPSDWDTAYFMYYIRKTMNTYEPVEGVESAPTWEPDTFYRKYDASKLYDENNVLNYNLYRFDINDDIASFETVMNDIQAKTNDTLIEILSSYRQKLYDGGTSCAELDDLLDHMEVKYIPETEYHQSQYVYDTETLDLYLAITNFTATDLLTDVTTGKLVNLGVRSQLHQRLVQFIKTNFEDVVRYESGSLQMYPIYARSKMRLFLEKGTKLPSSGQTPIGNFVPLTKTFQSTVDIQSAKYPARPLHVFRLEDTSISDLSGFRMYDGDVDISANTLLILNGIEYVMLNDQWIRNRHV